MPPPDDTAGLSVPGDLASFLTADGGDSAASLAFLARHPSLLADLDPGRATWSDESGSRCGAWMLEDLIAHGGFASVYAASRDGTPVAVKLAPRDDPRGTAALRHEFRITRGLRHPGLLLPSRFEEIEGRGLLELPKLPGPDLGRLLAHDGDALPAEEQVLDWFARLAEALAHLHERGIVHRDVKPGNLVLDRDGRPRLLDFGLATSGDSTLGPGLRELAGTLPYMSPEQTLGGLTAVGPASDVYSLAVTMLELLQGMPIAERSGRERMFESIAFAEVPLDGRADRPLPGRLRAVFAKATRKAPRDRYQDATALLDDLRALRAGAPLRHAAEPLGARIGRRLRRHRKAAIAVTIALLAAVGTPVILSSVRHADARAAVARLAVALRDGERGAGLLAAFDAAWHANPASAGLRELLLDHRDALGRHSTQRILATAGLRSAEPSPLLEAEGNMARRIHSLCGGADFVLQAAWSALLTAGPEAAASALRSASPTEAADLRLVELQALVSAELLDHDRLSAAEALLRQRTDRATLTVTELCLRSYRLIHRVQSAHRTDALRLADGEITVCLDEAQLLVDTVLASAPDCRLASTCDALLDLWTRQYAAAATRFVELATTARDAPERHALQLHATLAQSCHGASGGTTIELRPVPRATSDAAWWLTRYAALLREEPVVARWLGAVDPAAIPAADRESLAALTAGAMSTASSQGDWQSFRELAEGAVDWDSRSWSAAARERHAELLLIGSVVATGVARYHAALERDAWQAFAQRAARRAIDLELPRREEFEAVLETMPR